MIDVRATRTLTLPTIEVIERPRPTHRDRVRDLEEARLLLCVLIDLRCDQFWNEEFLVIKRPKQDARQREQNRVAKAATIEILEPPLSAGSPNIRNTDFISAGQDIIPFDIWDSLSFQEQKNVYNIQEKFRKSRRDLQGMFRRTGYLDDDQWSYKSLVLDSQKVYYKHLGNAWTDPIIINDVSWQIEPGINLVPKPFMDLWEQSQRERQPPPQENVPTKRRQKIEFEWPNLSASMGINPVGAVNIKDLGAKGDGITDDTGALKARSDALGKDWERIVALTRAREERFNGVRAPEGTAWKDGQIVPARPKKPLAGKRFVITGTLSKTRTDMTDDIRSYGGQVQIAVTKETDYLIQGESPGAVKMEASRRLNIPVIGEKALDAMIAGTSRKILEGKRFILIGSFAWTLTSLEDFIRLNGGEFQRDLLLGTDAVILGEQSDRTRAWVRNTLDEAKRAKIPVLREIDFVQAVQEKRDPLTTCAFVGQ